jgi:hypothetical protein
VKIPSIRVGNIKIQIQSKTNFPNLLKSLTLRNIEKAKASMINKITTNASQIYPNNNEVGLDDKKFVYF